MNLVYVGNGWEFVFQSGHMSWHCLTTSMAGRCHTASPPPLYSSEAGWPGPTTQAAACSGWSMMTRPDPLKQPPALDGA